MYKELFRRIELQVLMNLTAYALHLPTIRIWHLSHKEALKCYAKFTSDNLSDDIAPEILQRMNTLAYQLGKKIRLLFFVRSKTAAQELVVKLYRNIGIHMSFEPNNQVYFHRCFFSYYYSSDICQAASSLDDGIIRGITGCGQLTFKQRITENCKYCIAQYIHEEKSNYNR